MHHCDGAEWTMEDYVTAVTTAVADCRRHGRPNGPLHWLRDQLVADLDFRHRYPAVAMSLLGDIDRTIDRLLAR